MFDEYYLNVYLAIIRTYIKTIKHGNSKVPRHVYRYDGSEGAK